ncbi:hypothetical protein PENSPDRAFT_594601 [Peniophora sp. CONT]|nr:hypothetical protein PENSPDRAFT_594601 [Peniophora sp. CONT]
MFNTKRTHLRLANNARGGLHFIREIIAPEPIDFDWWGDASTSFGIGVTVGRFWDVWTWRKGVRVGPKQDYDIGCAEA